MLRKLLGVLPAVLVLALPAMAAPIVPIISGTYVFSSRSICQSDVTVTGDVAAVDVFTGASNPADMHFTSGTAKITPATGMGKFTGFQTGGTVLTLQTHGVNEGSSISDVPISTTVTFTNTATTVNFNGQTFHAAYAAVNKTTGIAGYVEMWGIANPASCIQQIELTRV